MKNALVILTFMAIAAVSVAQDTKMNNFKVNIISPIVKTGSFFYERKINEKSSAQLGVGFTAYNRDGTKITGIFITPEYRFYLSNTKEAIEGFYVAPYLRYQNLKVEETGESTHSKATLSTFGGGLLVGHQWIFSDIISLDIFLGPNYSSGKIKVSDDSSSEPDVPGSFDGFGLRVGITLGVVF